MECSRIRLMLDEYIAGRLDPDASGDVACHIKECPRCAEDLILLKEINDVIDVEQSVYPSLDFTSMVTGMIKNENARKTGFIFGKFPLINLGVSLVLTGLLTIFVNTPSINQVINKSVSGIANGAASINTNINITTGQVGGYFKNIINPGGRLK